MMTAPFLLKNSLFMAHVEENKLTSQLGICRGKADVQKNPAQTDFNACSFLKKSGVSQMCGPSSPHSED